MARPKNTDNANQDLICPTEVGLVCDTAALDQAKALIDIQDAPAV